MKTEDASQSLHLSLVDSTKDDTNPNPGVYTYDERAQGQGTWLVIINSGYNWEQFPEEFGQANVDRPRPLRIWSVPSHVRNRPLERDELDRGDWIPDDDLDYATPFEGVPEGHGTQTALVAAGLQSGVARSSGLYLIKAGGAILDKDSQVLEEDVCADSLLPSLRHVVEKLQDGTLIPGKTVMLIDTLWHIDGIRKEMAGDAGAYQEWHDEVEKIFHELDDLGVTVVISAGNDGDDDPPGSTDAYMPNILASDPKSPLILAGAVNYMGQLARFSSPGTDKLPITCYAMGKAVKLIDLSIEEETEQDGTTFSAAIVAGLVACYLSHPDFSERFKWSAGEPRGSTVGNRLKEWLATEGKGSFERTAPSNVLEGPRSSWKNYPVPDHVNTAYNYAHGSQGGKD